MAKAKQTETVIIKGVGSGLLILLDDKAGWPALLRELDERLRENAGFFQGAQATVNLGGRELDAAAIGDVQATLAALEVGLSSVVSSNPATREAASSLGLEARPPSFSRKGQIAEAEAEPEAAAVAAFNLLEIAAGEQGALFIPRTLRSGQRVQHDGHVCIVGDVNAGAEIVAGGSVLVWGSLRGLIHAGAGGDNTAMICALLLEPTQLRIAESVGRGPGPQTNKPGGMLRRLRRGKGEQAVVPECARVQNGQIVVESWNKRNYR